MTYTVSYSGQHNASGEPLFIITNKKSFVDTMLEVEAPDYPTSKLTLHETVSALFNLSKGAEILVSFKVENLPLHFFENSENGYGYDE